MSPALLPLLALLAAADAPDLDRAPPPDLDPAWPPSAEPSRPAPPFEGPEARPLPPRPYRPARARAGLAYGPARGSLDGLRLESSAFELSADLVPARLLGFDGLRFGLIYASGRTPARLLYEQWRPSLSFFWSLGGLWTSVGGGLSMSVLQKAKTGSISRGSLAGLSPFGRLSAGAELGPVGPLFPFVELEGAAQPDSWLASLRFGLRVDLTGDPAAR